MDSQGLDYWDQGQGYGGNLVDEKVTISQLSWVSEHTSDNFDMKIDRESILSMIL
jgi:hypothetical protein